MKYTKKFLSLAESGRTAVTPLEGMQISARLFMHYCGISLGWRTIAENAFCSWQDLYCLSGAENAAEWDDMSSAELMPLVVPEYNDRREFYDSFDVTAFREEDLPGYALKMCRELDEKTAAVICYGIKYYVEDLTYAFLRWTPEPEDSES